MRFVDEVGALTAEAARLKQSGVNIIIAVGHSGFPTDKLIAEKVPDVDVVVGGHSNTFLYSGQARAVQQSARLLNLICLSLSVCF